jgi:hypothetical protein
MNNVQEVIDYYYYYGLFVSSVRSVQLRPDTLDGEVLFRCLIPI